ncbi:ATP-binding protein [Eubacteriaceae bacterium ES3]|nr:ATP-binding protein [Eubacteriaceae bacterium ES3]
MKQLLVLSGKGGTGKTTVASAFIRLSKALAYADCDVDAPNLHLIMENEGQKKETDFYGMGKALIAQDICIKCGACKFLCRFDSVIEKDGFTIDPYACEGCGVCEAFCPAKAISMNQRVDGDLILYTGDAVFSTAKLKMGSGTTGLLVTEVKKQMRAALKKDVDLAIIDGSPGIGCPVIASLSGVDLVLIVTEPSISGISDLERIVKTARVFHTKTVVCVNKADTSPENTEKIKDYCRQEELSFMGEIPYDQCAVQAVNDGKTVVDKECPAGFAVRDVFNQTLKVLYQKN